MKTRAAVLAVALLAGGLSACDQLGTGSKASEGDKALCVYISRLSVGERVVLAVRGERESSLLNDATDGVLIGLVSSLNRTELTPNKRYDVLTRCREIGAL